jgi:hypothetical protein
LEGRFFSYSSQQPKAQFVLVHVLIIISMFVDIFNLTCDINEFLLMLYQSQHQQDFLLLDECKHSIFGVPSIEANNSYGRPTFESEFHQFDLNGDFNRSCYAAFNGTDFGGEDAVPHIPTYLPSLCPPPSAFLLIT